MFSKTHFFLIAIIFTFCYGCNQAAEANPVNNESEQVAEQPPTAQGQASVVDHSSEQNILNVALGSDDHTTLVAAVQAAQLENVLVNAGPLTVFAPTNAAFDALPDGTVEELLKPENKAKLQHIIKYHAAPGAYTGANIKGVMGIGQATGEKVQVEINEAGETLVNGAKVLATVKASNGYVHVIDKVLLPPKNE